LVWHFQELLGFGALVAWDWRVSHPPDLPWDIWANVKGFLLGKEKSWAKSRLGAGSGVMGADDVSLASS
jgi:hypothetical protein